MATFIVTADGQSSKPKTMRQEPIPASKVSTAGYRWILPQYDDTAIVGSPAIEMFSEWTGRWWDWTDSVSDGAGRYSFNGLLAAMEHQNSVSTPPD